MNSLSLPNRPADVRNSFRLFVASLVLETLGFVFSGTYDWGSVLGVLFGVGITFFLMVKANEGHHWARVALAVIVGLGVVTLVYLFADSYRQNPGETVIDAISTLVTLIAVVLLFSKSSNAWFARRS